MPPREEIVRSIKGAYRIGLFDASAVPLFNLTIDGFWRSFFAAVLVAPFFALTVALGLKNRIDSDTITLALLVESGTYLFSWAFYPILLAYVTRFLGLSANYATYIIVYNWANVVRMMVFFPIIVLEGTNLLPQTTTVTLLLCAVVAGLVYHWVIVRMTLGADTAIALGLVALEFVLSLLIDFSTARLLDV
ncbi:MAG: hypothetical protein EXQ91_05950 [Alphaproteobacteria bacterium]|nr:hypothetical protein [Alphaproteobacteria bacterium]